MFHVLIELTVSTKLLNVSNIQKEKALWEGGR